MPHRKLTIPIAVVASLFAIVCVLDEAAAAAPHGKWVEVRSPNFIVVSNAGEGQARKVAVQFERIRALFRDSLPYAKQSSSPVITILAVKDEDSLRELLPEYWTKGHAHPGGIFINRYDQLQIAVNLSAQYENAYEAVYHEYYHSVTVPFFPGLPTWVAEGLADFYGNSTIGDKTADVGLPSAGLIDELRVTNDFIPLDVLFKVDHSSPYYNEQNKVSVFYAESWALVHYFMLGDNGAHKAAFGAYLQALSEGASQDGAAAKAFGDLHKLQDELKAYAGRFLFPALKIPAPPKPSGDIAVHALSDASVDAYSGGFLALHEQFDQAEPLLKEAVQLDPRLSLAQRNLALLHYFRHEGAEALASLSAAIALDSEAADLRYFRAELTFQDLSRTDPQIEDDLRRAIAGKPDFAAPYGLLAFYLLSNNDKIPEALACAQKSVSLEPGNISYQFDLAQVLLRAARYNEAEAWGRRVRANATDDAFRSQADQLLNAVTQAREYAARVKAMQEEQEKEAAAARALVPSDRPRAEQSGEETPPPAQVAVAQTEVPVLKYQRGSQDTVEGVVTLARCNGVSLEIHLKVATGLTLLFRATDRTRVTYTSIIHAVHGDIEPCTELQGHTATIDFTAQNKSLPGEVTGIEITK